MTAPTPLPIPDLNLGGTSSASGLADSSSTDDFINEMLEQTDAATATGDVQYSGGHVHLGGDTEDGFFDDALNGLTPDQQDAGQGGLAGFVIPAIAVVVVVGGAYYFWQRSRG